MAMVRFNIYLFGVIFGTLTLVEALKFVYYMKTIINNTNRYMKLPKEYGKVDEYVFQTDNVSSLSNTVNTTLVMAPMYIDGRIIFQTDVSKYWDQPLRKWNPFKEILAFIHIAKTGGTALRLALSGTSIPRFKCRMHVFSKLNEVRNFKPDCNGLKPILSGRHYDWSIISAGTKKGLQMAPILVLRNPVERFLSNFYYLKVQNWTQTIRMRNQTLMQYLTDISSLQQVSSDKAVRDSVLRTRCVWSDGMGAANWLAGTHGEKWVHYNWTETSPYELGKLSSNWTYMLKTAVDNLHSTLWFGIMEQLQQSIELLIYQTGLKIRMFHVNKTPPYPSVTKDETEIIKKLLPMDVYIYNYAKGLFNNRWQKYIQSQVGSQKQVSSKLKTQPVVLTSTIHGCTSTIKTLSCPGIKLLQNSSIL